MVYGVGFRDLFVWTDSTDDRLVAVCGGIHVYRILRKHHLFSDGYGDGVKLSPLHTPKWEKSHVGQYTLRVSRKASVLITRIERWFIVVRGLRETFHTSVDGSLYPLSHV